MEFLQRWVDLMQFELKNAQTNTNQNQEIQEIIEN
jgi:hypothetical protein